MSGTTLGTLPPGDVGFYAVDWSDQLGAVAGDALDGTPSIECTSVDLNITNARLAGAVLTFNASSATAATYRLVARAAFAPSGRRASQPLTLIVGDPPAIEPLTLDEARRHLRLDASGNPPQHPDDDLILGWITAARQQIEQETGLTLVTRAVTDYRDSWPASHEAHAGRRRRGDGAFPGEGDFLWSRGHGEGRQSFTLDRNPVLSVDRIRYFATDGTDTVLDPALYRATPDIVSGSGAALRTRIEPAFGQSFPATAALHGAVRIEYTAGWPGPIEEALRAAIRLVLTALYESRGMYGPEQEPQGLCAIITPYRIF